MQTQAVTGEGTYTYGYDELGRNDYLEYPDGHVRRQVFDDLGRITSRCYEYTGGPQTRCYTAQYDAVGNPVAMLDPEGEDVFEYDALDRLKKATRKDTAGVVIEVDDYEFNAIGALKKNAGVLLDHQRPRLDGGGNADAAVPATAGGQAVTLDSGGRITSYRGTTFTWSKGGFLKQVQEPTPALLEEYGVDSDLRRTMKIRGTNAEFYVFEGLDRVATVNSAGALLQGWIFDGIDHPIRMKVPGTPTAFYYYELDLAGNVRRVRASGGGDLGGYRYTAFGQTKEDTASIVQPLRWKGRWHATVSGAEIYDVRARQWAPEIGSFFSVDEFNSTDSGSTSSESPAFGPTLFDQIPVSAIPVLRGGANVALHTKRSGHGYHDMSATLWGWPSKNPIRFMDPSGHEPYRDPDPLPPNARRCMQWHVEGSKAREICCKLACGAHYGGFSGGAYDSCVQRCSPFPMCRKG